MRFGLSFLSAVCAFFWAGVHLSHAQTPLPPTNLQAQFQRNGNYTDLQWRMQGRYQVAADLRLNSRYNFPVAEVLGAWDQQGGSWSVNGAILSQISVSLQPVFRAWPGGLAMRDYDFTVRVRSSILTGYVGVAFRFTNANNYYYVAVEPLRVALYRRVNGTDTLLAQQAQVRAAGTWYTIRVAPQGTNIRATVGNIALSATDNSHPEGSVALISSGILSDFTGPTTELELRNSGGMVRFTPTQIFGGWTRFGAGTWAVSPNGYELRQSINTAEDTGYFNPKHTTLRDYTYIQQMRISPLEDNDVIGLVVRYTQNQASPHRFTAYVFEWNRGDAGGQPNRRLVRVTNGGYGTHGGSWPRINHTTLFSDNVTWVGNTWYTVRVTLSGQRIRIWINGVLWADFTDNSNAAIQQGAAGPLNWSNPNYNARHVTLYYGSDLFANATATAPVVSEITNTYTRLNATSVGTLLTTPIATWATTNDIPLAFLSVDQYRVAFEDPSTFEGLISPDGVASTPSDGTAFAYGRQRAGTLRYHVYRNNTRITTTPVTTQTYRDTYTACVPAPNTTYNYQVTALNPANNESGRSNTASITTANDPPTISGVPNQTGAHGVSWNLDLTPYINDPNAAKNTLVITENSAFVTVSGQTLTFLYPAASGITAQDVIITVTDCHGAQASQTIRVTLQNRPPVFTTTAPNAATEKATYVYDANANDPDTGDTVNYKITQAPAGATIDPTTGRLSWTPTNADSGKTLTFEIEACDNRTPPACTRQTWQVNVSNVNDPPVITSTPPTTATEDQAYTYQVTATDPDPNETLNYKLKTAPPGATIDPATGAIRWTPGNADAGKDVDFEVEVCDKAGACVTQSWKTKVTNVNDPPVISSTPPTTATEDQAYTYEPTVTDPDPSDTHTWKFKKSPAGATIDPTTGKVTWTPGDADAGKEVEFEIEVCDAAGACVSQPWKTNVTNVNDPPVITSTPPATTDEGTAFSYKPTATDPDPNDTQTWKLTKGPADAQINPQTGEVTWTSKTGDANKEIDFEIEVCDAAGSCTRQSWKTKVNNVNDPPVITSSPPTEAFVGREMNYKPTVTDPDTGDTHTWKLTKAPAGATIDPATGELKWTPAAADAGKDFEFTVEACDNGTPPRCVTQTFKVKAKVPCVVDIDCPTGDICTGGACIVAGCASQTPQCPTASDICLKSQCVADPCANKTCAAGELCRPSDGLCIKPCAGVTCPQGEVCVDGTCTTDTCAAAGKTCAADEICDGSNGQNPQCIKNPCGATSCRFGRVCSEGACVDDPCPRMTCPDPSGQRCVAGQCIDRQTCKVDLDCPSSDICVNNRCVPSGCYTQTPQCTQTNQLCLDGGCKDNTCITSSGASPCAADEFCRPVDGKCAKPCATVQCPSGQRCVDGGCQADPCSNVQCAAGQVCVAGQCQPDNCNASNVCKHGRICRADTNTCASDPCASVTCPDNRQVCSLGQCAAPPTCTFDKDCPNNALCVTGKCVPSTCDTNTPCPQGKLCSNGTCLEDPCTNANCPADQVCKAGSCVGLCLGVFCPKGQICTNGQCNPDPCASVQCPQGEICKGGTCTPNACQNDSCKQGRLCDVNRCIDDPCGGLRCPTGSTCQNGQCIGDKPCKNDADCGGDGVCIQKICKDPGCYRDGCPQGKLCLAGQCVDDPCAAKQCAAGERCRPADAACVKDCPSCPAGQRCTNGQCEADPCAGVTCKDGERCVNGACVTDACTNPNAKLCKYQRACDAETCSDDLCAGLQCAADQTCRAGICVNPTGTTEGITEGITEGTTETITDASEPSAETASEPSNDGVLPDGIVNTEDSTGDKIVGESGADNVAGDTGAGIVGGGCNCSTSTPSTPWFFGLLCLLLLAYRRRLRI